MRLSIVRHAIAEDRDNDRWPDDSNRPLTPKGERRFRKAARGLEKLAAAPDVVLSSPYVRAWDTALILQDEAGWPRPQPCSQLATDSPADVLNVLAAYDANQTVALVGHEPLLGRFASALLAPSAAPFVELRKGGAVCIDRPDARPSTLGTLVWALPPRALRRLGKC